MKLLPETIVSLPQGDALLFAPELILLNLLDKEFTGRVYTTDFNSVDVDFPGEDIQALSFPEETYSLIICNHVLEHVPDDQKALDECARILKSGGNALFTVPGDFGGTTWAFDEPDSNGHYRHYGLDIVEKMNNPFNSVKVIDMGKITIPRWKVRQGDMCFVCAK